MTWIPDSHQHHIQATKFHPTKPRRQNHYTSHSRPGDIYKPAFIPAPSKQETWLIELWKDFVLERTPCLAICVTYYLGLLWYCCSIIRLFGTLRTFSYNFYLGMTILERPSSILSIPSGAFVLERFRYDTLVVYTFARFFYTCQVEFMFIEYLKVASKYGGILLN
ncbi:hypothetical protein EYC80_008846 [Monilinia laxa]|uniref:Uncharacterized protein n=1 Tax=Monilinia laxa TaxID=61186 RepID=A0A5N6K1K6_MONLA|nr:hypothetical protein EYC80_008846 [Monilinia laxa]